MSLHLQCYSKVSAYSVTLKNVTTYVTILVECDLKEYCHIYDCYSGVSSYSVTSDNGTKYVTVIVLHHVTVMVECPYIV